VDQSRDLAYAGGGLEESVDGGTAALTGLLDRGAGHESGGGGAVPVGLARFEEDAVAGPDHLDRAALGLKSPTPSVTQIVQRAERVSIWRVS
jgi:hypothetical protein